MNSVSKSLYTHEISHNQEGHYEETHNKDFLCMTSVIMKSGFFVVINNEECLHMTSVLMKSGFLCGHL